MPGNSPVHGREIEFAIGFGIDHLNPGARHCGSIGVFHRPFDAAAVGLRKEQTGRRN
jgi:hypothetical protein